MVLLLFFVDFESDGVVVIEEDAEEVVKVDLLEPLGNLVDVVGHDQVRHYIVMFCCNCDLEKVAAKLQIILHKPQP